jgi:hypothetical protein
MYAVAQIIVPKAVNSVSLLFGFNSEGIDGL